MNEEIEDAFDLEILRFIDGKRNIKQIAEQTGYTYKSVFYRLENMQKQEWVIGTKTQDITQGLILSINPKFKTFIQEKLKLYETSYDIIEGYMEEHKTKLLNFLKYVDDNRWISYSDMNNYVNKENIPPVILEALERLGVLRYRVEATKLCKRILRQKEL